MYTLFLSQQLQHANKHYDTIIYIPDLFGDVCPYPYVSFSIILNVLAQFTQARLPLSQFTKDTHPNSPKQVAYSIQALDPIYPQDFRLIHHDSLPYLTQTLRLYSPDQP
jgi:hypothetical protein